jgi:glycosyltransferase involved in cell wall biosynthesis
VFDKADQSRGHIRAFVRKAIEVPDDHIIVLMVGKLVSWKRQRDLVMFANDMSVRGRKITVVLAGSGPDETSLKEKAFVNGAGGVVFAGFVSPSELVGYYLASDIYAHCAEHEPHSLAISEAIYSGLPVVLSHRCGSYGPTDDVRPGQNGFVYTCGNHCELSTALTTLIENPGLRKGMSSESRLIGKTNQELAHGKALLQVLTLLQHP